MNLKRQSLILLAAGILAGAAPARAEHTTCVIGLVSLTNYQAALLAITNSPPEASFLMGTHKWVTEGQEFDDLYLKAKRLHVKIRRIDAVNGAVQAKENSVELLYVPMGTNLAAAAVGKNVLLDHADFDDALDLYAMIKDRTVLVHPEVKPAPVSISAEASNRTDVVTILEKALRGKGMTIVADGNRFEWLMPAGATNPVLPAAIPPGRSSKAAPTNTADTLPADSLNFSSVDLRQVMDVYQALTGQKWVQETPLPSTNTISFHNQTPLTKAETIHAFDVLFAWQGLKVANVDDKSFKLVSVPTGE